MEAKEKAKALVDRFLFEVDQMNPLEDIFESAKKCALICVDRMLEFAYGIEWEKKEEAISKLKVLKEVKKEIQKL